MIRTVERLIKYYDQETKVKAVELGDFTGSDAFSLLEKCPGLVLHWVCPWRQMIQNSNCGITEEKLTERYEEGKKNLEKFNNRFQVINGYYNEASYSFKDDSLDFVFFNNVYDDDEEKIKQDILLWIPKVKDEGMVIGSFCHIHKFKSMIIFFSKKLDFVFFDEGTWVLSPINQELREWAIENSKREGDWNESGYFESTRPDLRPRN